MGEHLNTFAGELQPEVSLPGNQNLRGNQGHIELDDRPCALTC